MAKQDYYEILGVKRDASAEDIKRAYRKMAMESHPDRNPGDAAAERRFKDAAEAYAVLADEGKRQAYDRFGHAGVDAQFGGGAGSFTNVEEIFAAFGDLFGGGGGIFESFFGGAGGRRRGRRGASLRVDLELTLEEVAVGVKRTLELTRPKKCDNCSGSGAKPGTSAKTCSTCGGAGQVLRSQGFLTIRQPCPSCRGEGTVIETPCPSCRGRGAVASKEPVHVTIPPGIEEGHVERIAGQGEPGDGGGPPGDLVVVIHVQPHAVFIRNGDDLVARAAIRFRQAALGDTVEVPTVTGEMVSLKIPPGTQPGDGLRVRGHGLPRADGYGKGNLIVKIQIEVPKSLTPEQTDALLKFDARCGRRGEEQEVEEEDDLRQGERLLPMTDARALFASACTRHEEEARRPGP
jgi:molecular chaperone DnaJ